MQEGTLVEPATSCRTRARMGQSSNNHGRKRKNVVTARQGARRRVARGAEHTLPVRTRLNKSPFAPQCVFLRIAIGISSKIQGARAGRGSAAASYRTLTGPPHVGGVRQWRLFDMRGVCIGEVRHRRPFDCPGRDWVLPWETLSWQRLGIAIQ